ncbi:MAG: alpha/beta fold hydrolase [Variovorax sp.]
MKPVLLLIPGMLNSAAVWAQVAPLLADVAEVRIANVQTQASIADMARDAWVQLADVPDATPIILCGFSMGGYVTIQMLADLRRPIGGAAFLDTSARPETAEGAALREKAIASIGRDFDKFTSGLAPFSTHPSRHADAAFMAHLLGLLRELGGATAIRQNRAIMGRGDHREALAALRISTLVTCGRGDRITPPELSEELADLIPSAQLEWIDDAGHMTPIEQPARVAELLRSLISTTPTGDPE